MWKKCGKLFLKKWLKIGFFCKFQKVIHNFHILNNNNNIEIKNISTIIKSDKRIKRNV